METLAEQLSTIPGNAKGPMARMSLQASMLAFLIQIMDDLRERAEKSIEDMDLEKYTAKDEAMKFCNSITSVKKLDGRALSRTYTGLNAPLLIATVFHTEDTQEL